MSVIGMIGPHAAGKTTAGRRWLARYRGLTVCNTDGQSEESAAGKVRVNDWKGDKTAKAARCLHHIGLPGVSLIESARGFSTWLSVFRPGDPLIVLWSTEQDGRRWLLGRRAGNGNEKPLSDYWTPKRLGYECKGHKLTCAARCAARGLRVFKFHISDRDADWGPVDECFGTLYRELHNRRNRK